MTFRYTAPARAGNGGRGHGCCPVPIRPTQWLTRPNGAVLSPPAGRRSSLCQQHRDPGIEWTCISSLCPSASRPSKVGPGCRPELQPAYSRTRCLPSSEQSTLRAEHSLRGYSLPRFLAPPLPAEPALLGFGGSPDPADSASFASDRSRKLTRSVLPPFPQRNHFVGFRRGPRWMAGRC